MYELKTCSHLLLSFRWSISDQLPCRGLGVVARDHLVVLYIYSTDMPTAQQTPGRATCLRLSTHARASTAPGCAYPRLAYRVVFPCDTTPAVSSQIPCMP